MVDRHPDSNDAARAHAANLATPQGVTPLWVCQAAVSTLPFAGASLTLMTDTDHQEPICATNEVARRIDELQFELGEGPCLDAYTSSRAVLVANLAKPTDHRWPFFAHTVADRLARTLFAIPLRTSRTSIGVFCLYRTTSERLLIEDLVSAIRFADAATMTLVSTRRRTLSRASLRWAEVHRATELLRSQMGASIETSRACLRAHAFAHDRSLSEVAHEVVHRLDHDRR